MLLQKRLAHRLINLQRAHHHPRVHLQLAQAGAVVVQVFAEGGEIFLAEHGEAGAQIQTLQRGHGAPVKLEFLEHARPPGAGDGGKVRLQHAGDFHNAGADLFLERQRGGQFGKTP